MEVGTYVANHKKGNTPPPVMVLAHVLVHHPPTWEYGIVPLTVIYWSTYYV